MVLLQAVWSPCFSSSPARPLGSSRVPEFGVLSRRVDCIVRNCELTGTQVSLQQCQLGRSSGRLISLAQSSRSSAPLSFSEEQDTIDPGLLARVSKLYRPAVILPVNCVGMALLCFSFCFPFKTALSWPGVITPAALFHAGEILKKNTLKPIQCNFVKPVLSSMDHYIKTFELVVIRFMSF